MKEKTKIILTMIITFIVTLTLTVTASLVTNATNITYTSDKTDKTNVNDSLDELYDMASNGGSGEITNAYGVMRPINNNTSSAWARIGLSKGKVANATKDGSEVVNDFDNIYPWSEIKSYNYDTDTESITAWYGEDNFTFTPTDETTEVLTYIPEFYYQRYQDNEFEYIYISKDAKEGFTKSEAFSVGRYTMSGSSSRVHSKSGVVSLRNVTITNFRTYATALGSGFQQLDYHYFVLQLLYLVEYADYNSQEKLGLGNVSNSGAVTSGGCDTLGMKSGTLVNDGKHSMIYRGIEDIYGNVFQFVDGVNVQNYQAYINYNPATYQVDKFDGDYQIIGYINGSGGDNYIMKMGYDVNNELIAFPDQIGGNETTYITDYYWNSSGNMTLRVGGAWDYSTKCGLFSFTIDGVSSFAHTKSGARLLKTS